MEKDVGFRIRLDRALRDEFLEVCRDHDRPAAQVLREFMRQYIASWQRQARDWEVRERRVEKK